MFSSKFRALTINPTHTQPRPQLSKDTYLKFLAATNAVFGLQFLLIPKTFMQMYFDKEFDQHHTYIGHEHSHSRVHTQKREHGTCMYSNIMPRPRTHSSDHRCDIRRACCASLCLRLGDRVSICCCHTTRARPPWSRFWAA